MAYLSLARIKKLVHSGKGIYICTCPGDGLGTLGSFEAFLIPGKLGPDRPPYEGRLDAIPSDACQVQVQRNSAVRSGRCRISIAPDTGEFSGYWLFVNETALHADKGSDLYVFELLQYRCMDRGGAEGVAITGYSETGAHGLLEVKWQGRTILVPLSDKHVLIDQENATVTFTDLRSLDPSDD